MDFDKLKNDLIKSKYYYYHTDNGILLNGDCLEIMKILPNDIIDGIITSPPYNISIDYGIYKDDLEFDVYFDFIKKILIEFERILVNGGRFGINHLMDCSRVIRYSPIMEIYSLIIEIENLYYYTTIDLNEKSPHISKKTAWGSWLSPNSPYIYNPKEGIIIGYKKHWKRNKKGDTDLTKEEFMNLVNGVWDYFPQTKQLTKCNFSFQIPYNFLKINTYINDIILDPFMGSGTTAVVSEKLNRKWIGIELNPEYCKIIKQRIINEVDGQLF